MHDHAMGTRTLPLAFDRSGNDAAPIRLGPQAFVCRTAPLRHMVTPGGRKMSVAMTSCGAAGWLSDARGYRYVAVWGGADRLTFHGIR